MKISLQIAGMQLFLRTFDYPFTAREIAAGACCAGEMVISLDPRSVFAARFGNAIRLPLFLSGDSFGVLASSTCVGAAQRLPGQFARSRRAVLQACEHGSELAVMHRRAASHSGWSVGSNGLGCRPSQVAAQPASHTELYRESSERITNIQGRHSPGRSESCEESPRARFRHKLHGELVSRSNGTENCDHS